MADQIEEDLRKFLTKVEYAHFRLLMENGVVLPKDGPEFSFTIAMRSVRKLKMAELALRHIEVRRVINMMENRLR